MLFLILFTFFYFVYCPFICFAKWNIKFKLLFILLPTFFISAFRYNIGIDFLSYVDYYKLSIAGKDTYIDYSYKMISMLTNAIGGNEQFVFFVYSLITFIMIYKIFLFVYNEYNMQTYALVFLCFIFYSFFFFLSLNQIRSSVSCLFVTYALLMPRKNIIGFFYLSLGVFFHSAAVFFIPIYFLINKIKLNFFYFLFFAFLILVMIGDADELVKYVLSSMDSRFLVYYGSEYFRPKEGFERLYTLFSTFVLFFAFLFFNEKDESKYQLLMKLFLVYLLIKILSLDILIFARIGDFLKPVSLIFFSFLIYSYIPSAKSDCRYALFFLEYSIILAICLLNVVLGSNIHLLFSEYTYNFNFCFFGEICQFTID